MTVTQMSHRDSHVTVTHLSRVSHVPQRSVPPTRPDPTRPISVLAVACLSGSNRIRSNGDLRALGFGLDNR